MEYENETKIAQAEIQIARDILPDIKIPQRMINQGLELIHSLGINSLRAEITLFEAIRAFAALDNRKAAKAEDLNIIAPMALRLRRTEFIDKYLSEQSDEEQDINNSVKKTVPKK